jgi:structure-specific recognition protein 1
MPSAFIVFSNQNRDQVKQDKPNASFGDIGRELGKRWNALTDEEKAKYVGKTATRRRKSKKSLPTEEEPEEPINMDAVDKLMADKPMADKPMEAVDKLMEDKPMVDKPMATKKPKTRKRRGGPSSFIKFSNEKREEVKRQFPKATFGELGKRLGKMWRALSDEEKQKYSK